MTKPLSIIIPTRERETILWQSVACLADVVRHIPHEIIVINDSSSPLSAALLPKLQAIPFLKCLDAGGNGVAKARNLGVKTASHEMILFMDDDVLINKQALDRLIQFSEQSPGDILMPDWKYPDELNSKLATTAFGRFLQAEELNRFRGYRRKLVWKEQQTFEVEAIANFLVLLRKSDFLLAGGYNESFPFAGGEDTELSVRLAKNGARFFIDSSICVLHNESDRGDLQNWLARKERSGHTARTMSKLGFPEAAIRYDIRRSIPFTIIYRLRGLLIPLIVSKNGLSDLMKFRLIHLLIGAHIHHGYKKAG
jgi:GT2 family glycosyltransferase